MANTKVKKKDQLPAHLRDVSNQPARGSEQAGTDDITIPRIALVQALSPQIDDTDPAYIEGVKAGDIINSLTGENYGKELTIIPIYFNKEYVIWKDRKKGGGMFGVHQTKAEAVNALQYLDPPVEDYNVEDTVQQFVFIVNADGSITEAMLSMSRTKMSVSRKLQSLIRLTKMDSFACMYRLSVVAAQSDLGKYYNFAVTPAGYASEEHFYAAETCYNSITSNEKKYVAHKEEEEAF